MKVVAFNECFFAISRAMAPPNECPVTSKVWSGFWVFNSVIKRSASPTRGNTLSWIIRISSYRSFGCFVPLYPIMTFFSLLYTHVSMSPYSNNQPPSSSRCLFVSYDSMLTSQCISLPFINGSASFIL